MDMDFLPFSILICAQKTLLNLCVLVLINITIWGCLKGDMSHYLLSYYCILYEIVRITD